MDRSRHEANRASWNFATREHNAHKADQAGFLRAGGTTLCQEEIGLLGDVAGRRIVHLQCNSGQDSLSLVALGADVLGVDISDEAIDFARRLSEESGLAARFVRSDVFDWLEEAAPAAFDVVFTSYGALPWLTDLDAWARGVAKVLAPGGRLVVVEFHPFAWLLDREHKVAFPGMGGAENASPDGVGDYVGLAGGVLSPSGHVDFPSGVNPHPAYDFAWSTGDLLGAVLSAGLRVDRYVEWPWSNGVNLTGGLVPAEGGRFVPPPGTPAFPLMYGLVASREARR